MSYHYPRAAAVLRVPLFGSSAERARQAHGSDTIEVHVQVLAVTLEINSHLQADSCDLTIDYIDAGVDPRLLHACTVELYIYDQKEPTRTPLLVKPIFIGIADKIERRGGEGRESIVTIRFLDYTTMFLRNKHYPTEGVPKYDETLPEIWAKVCDHTGYWDVDTQKIVSSVEALRESIKIIGFDPSRKLGDSVPHRVAKFGAFPTWEGDSAWDIWQRACMFVGLISWIELDEVIVAPTTEHFTSAAAPRLILDQNVAEWSESVDSTVADRGICLIALDTVTGRVLEAFYPPPGDSRIHIKRSKARSKKFNPAEAQADHYDVFEMHDVTDLDALEKIAERTYAERSRQEVQGYVKTSEFVVLSSDATDQQRRDLAALFGPAQAESALGSGRFDLLSLRAGDLVRIELSPEYEEMLRSKGDTSSRVKYLTDRGYSDATAQLIASNVDALPSLKPEYHVKQMRITLDGHGDPGRFEIEIYYHNKIQVLGDSDDSS